MDYDKILANSARSEYLRRKAPKTVLQVYMHQTLADSIREYSAEQRQPLSVTVRDAFQTLAMFKRAIERGATAAELRTALRMREGED